MRTILIQGASTAAGWYDMEHAGWASRISGEMLRLNQNNPREAILVQNDAVPGNTLPAVLRDISRVDRFQRLGRVTGVLAIGLNESKIMNGSTRPLVSLSRFQESLEMYSEYMQSHNVDVVYVGTELLIRDKIVTENGNIFEDDLTAEYDEVLRQHAEYQKMPFVDTRSILRESDPLLSVCEDGYHPNALGHTALAHMIGDSLKNMGDLVSSGQPEGIYPHSA